MSLLINGMDMPEYRDVFGDERGCVYLLMLTVNKDGTASMQFNDVDGGFYRVKEIPTPHGRLIDADRLIKALEKQWNVDDDQDFANKTVWREIENAPTVIEKERE